MPMERLAKAKDKNTSEEELFEISKSAVYNDHELGLALAKNPNSSPRVMESLVRANYTVVQILESIAMRDMNRKEIYEIIHILDANMYDYTEEEWEKVRTAIITGESANKIQNDESFVHIFTDKYPGPNPLYEQFWY